MPIIKYWMKDTLMVEAEEPSVGGLETRGGRMEHALGTREQLNADEKRA
jgi:hypothetical protein